MADDYIRERDFNGAMHSLNTRIDELKDEQTAVRALVDAQIQQKIKDSRDEGYRQGTEDARMAAIEKRLDRLVALFTALGLGFLGALLWWAFLKLSATPNPSAITSPH